MTAEGAVLDPVVKAWRHEPSEESARRLKLPRAKLSKSQDAVGLRIEWGEAKPESEDAWQAFLTHLANVLVFLMVFLRKVLRSTAWPEAQQAFVNSAWPRLQTFVRESVIRRGCPCLCAGEAKRYQGSLKHFLRGLEAKMVAKSLVSEGACKPLEAFVREELQGVYLAGILPGALLRSRRIVVEDEYSAYPKDDLPFFQDRDVQISSSVVELVVMVEGLLDDACAEPGGDWPEDVYKKARRQSYLAARDCVRLWTALCPAVHGKNYAEVPSLALQFHNDALFLRHRLVALARERTWRLREALGGGTLLVDLVFPVRAAGEREFFATLANVRERLEQHVSGIHPVATVDERAFKELKDSLTDACQDIAQLEGLFKGRGERPLLPEKVLFQVLGALLEVVCSKVVATILQRAFRDRAIDTDEGQRICGLIAHVKEYPGIELLSHFAPSWGKFCRLRDVLHEEQKLKPLLEDVARGGYHSFTRDELFKLISVVWTESAVQRYNVFENLSKHLKSS